MSARTGACAYVNDGGTRVAARSKGFREHLGAGPRSPYAISDEVPVVVFEIEGAPSRILQIFGSGRMSNGRDAEETTVIATYTTRRDAEVARDYLADADIRSFVSSDDAGGMHPQMQAPHGVKLVGMAQRARRAREKLDEANLLPDGDDDAEADGTGPTGTTDQAASMLYGVALLLGALAVVLVLLMFVLG